MTTDNSRADELPAERASSPIKRWIGWPGSGHPPGHYWLPGPALRFATIGLVCGFFALALTVDYAYGIAFFLLALTGVLVGLRRGFLNGLSRDEKMVFVVFAAYTAVSILSFLCGLQTSIGFRFIGRDLRFLLFIPVYLSLRWVRFKRDQLGLALVIGSFAAAVTATVQVYVLGIPEAYGVTGTHIVFGDLALLSGFLGGACLLDHATAGFSGWRFLVILLGVTSGIWGSILSEARGSWVALPFLIILLFYNLWKNKGQTLRRISVVVTACIIAFVMLMVAIGPWQRIDSSVRAVKTFIIGAGSASSSNGCIGDHELLETLISHGYVKGAGARAYVQRLSRGRKKQAKELGCTANSELILRATSVGKAFLVLPRELRAGDEGQPVTVLASGNGWIKAGWRGPGIKVSSRRLRQFESPSGRNGSKSLVAVVSPGQQIKFIPIQQNNDFVRFLGESSAGNRFNMWRVAASLFFSHPVLGVGTGAYSAIVSDYISDGKAPPSIKGYQHAHSDYMTTIATKGVLGLTALLAMLMLPGFLAWRSSKRRHERGMFPEIYILAIPIFSITESMMVHSLVISWFVVCIAAVMSSADSPTVMGS